MVNDSSSPPGTAAALRATVRGDRLVQLMLLAFAATAALYLLPAAAGARRAPLAQAGVPCVFLGLAVVALRHGLGRLSAGESRFWNDVSGAFAAWLAAAVVRLAFPGAGRPIALDLVVEAFYAAYYVALILAAERRPHRARRWRAGRLDRALAWPAVLALVLGLFGYFIVLPLLADPLDQRATSRYVLYLMLDAYLAARFFVLAGSTRVPRWRLLYAVVGATAGGGLLNDLLALANVRAFLSWSPVLDLAFYLPFPIVVLTRARHFPFPKAAAPEDEDLPPSPLSGPSARTMVYALVFPLAHFGGHVFGLLGDTAKAARETLVFGVLLLLALLAVVQQRLWARKLRALWRERQEVKSSLRRSEKDLRMMVERFHVERQLRTAEKKFAKALRVSSDVIASSSLTDGRIADVNDSFKQVLGYRREEVLGKTVAEIELWDRPEERQIMVRLLERQGFVHSMEAEFRARDGSLVSGLLSAEKLTLDGEPYLLSVTHVPTAKGREGQAGDGERRPAPPAAAGGTAVS